MDKNGWDELFDEDERYTELALVVANELDVFLDDWYKKWKARGCKIKQLDSIALAAVNMASASILLT